MKSPKDYTEKAKPMPVSDKEAETGIKYSNIVSGLMLAVILGGTGMATWVGNHFINEASSFKADVIQGFKGVKESVDGVRSEISRLNTNTEVLKERVGNIDKRVTVIEQELRK